MRRNNGRGGMQTSSAQHSIICLKCGKGAVRRDGDSYMHFTKKGVVWHTVTQEEAQQAGEAHHDA